MRIYGLTGGIGSGKTEAARRFAWHGIPVIDADAIGHAVIGPGGSAVDEVVAAFGAEVLTDGIIDRMKVGARVFSNAHALQRLNGIVHPAIYREIATRCDAYRQDGHDAVIVEAALLAENGVKQPFFDGLIVVTCPVAIRVQRLVMQRGMDRADAERRIASQTPPERKIALADWVIENDGDRETLDARVDKIVAEMGVTHGEPPG